MAQTRLRRKSAIPWILATALFLSFWAIFFHAPAGEHSSDNNLLFYFASADSPLKASSVPLTAGVVPKRFHSHNDYEQSIPLFKALSYGAASVEADIYLVDDKLLVGHTEDELSPNKTLASLYLDPLVSLIRSANVDRQTGSRRGVFETAPFTPLHLLIDIKTDGPSTFAKLYSALEPLRFMGYLSTLDSHMTSTGTYHQSLLTVIGTGNTPLESVQALGYDFKTPRDIFLDAPLSALPQDHRNMFNATISPLASVDFGSTVGLGWIIPAIGRKRIRHLVEVAHAKGIQARFWNTPITPTWVRKYIWQILLDEGVDWLNVDDLPGAKDF